MIDTSDGARPQRAAAMPPDERRAAIIAATLPLVLEHGAAVSTRMIAQAAGIAEGTIFRVFADKDTLMEAVVETAFDPAPSELALAGIDLSMPLEARLNAAIVIVRRRVENIWRLASTIGVGPVPAEKRRTELPGLAALFEPDRDRINHEPLVAARMLRSMTMAFSHPMLAPEGPMPIDEIVSLLLDGIRVRTASTTPSPTTSSQTQES
ncbi:MAG: helix-turn-helix domain-containing protein [Ilumatobacteraceae bacterium]